MWKLISEEKPPTNRVIKTKIDDEKGQRNEQDLIFDRGLWWYPDKSMYVYYAPTHWWDWIAARQNTHNPQSSTNKLIDEI